MEASNNKQDNIINEDYKSCDCNLNINKYNLEWQQLNSGIEELRRRALTGALRVSRLRSIAWAILLEVLPQEADKWLDVIRRNRIFYNSLKDKYKCDPRCCLQPEDNPLSQNTDSIWNQYFHDTELQTIIKLDVVRAFPGVEFFKQPEIQQTMINVLFCFAREAPHIMYRQGMHEILAPILFVLVSDQRAAEHLNLSQELIEIMDPKYLEHDSYALFQAIMKGIEKFYRINESPPLSPSISDDEFEFLQNENKNVEVEVVQYLNNIKDSLLSQYDPELTNHLQKYDISLSLFGVRWLRVLFGREFSLHDLLTIWDAIFAENEDFSLIEYIMVAMLIAIRTPLLNKDAMICLTYLMHYPTTIDVQYIIEYSLYLKHPDAYCEPHPRNFNLFSHNKTQKKTVISSKSKIKIKPSRFKSSKYELVKSADDSEIIDGVTIQEFESLRNELHQVYQIMSVCNNKLEHCEDILRQTLPSELPLSHPTYQALSGIKEVCTILKNKLSNNEVEPAYEANESPNIHLSEKLYNVRKNTKVPDNLSIKSQQTSLEKELTLFNIINSNKDICGAPSLDPINKIKTDTN